MAKKKKTQLIVNVTNTNINKTGRKSGGGRATRAPAKPKDNKPNIKQSVKVNVSTAGQIPYHPFINTSSFGQKFGEQSDLKNILDLLAKQKNVINVNPNIAPNITPNITSDIKPNIAPNIEPTISPSITSDIKPNIKSENKPNVAPVFEPSFNPNVAPVFEPKFEPTINPVFETFKKASEENKSTFKFKPTIEPSILSTINTPKINDDELMKINKSSIDEEALKINTPLIFEGQEFEQPQEIKIESKPDLSNKSLLDKINVPQREEEAQVINAPQQEEEAQQINAPVEEERQIVYGKKADFNYDEKFYNMQVKQWGGWVDVS